MVGLEIWRGGQKIGRVEGSHIRSHDDTKLGYFEGNFIYNEAGHKLAYMEGDFLISEGGDSKIRLEKISGEVTGGVISEATRAAIYVLLGD